MYSSTPVGTPWTHGHPITGILYLNLVIDCELSTYVTTISAKSIKIENSWCLFSFGVALFWWSLRSKNRGSLLCSLITVKLPGPVLARNVHIAPLTHTWFNVIPNYWPENHLITSLYIHTSSLFFISVYFLYSSLSRVAISGVLKAF